MQQTIYQVSILGASACNLSCNFCYLGKNPFYAKYDEIIKRAWETGSYIETLKKVFANLGSDPTKVGDLQLWGGEPTLHIDLVAKQGEDLGKLFPNISQFLLPTNFNNFDVPALMELMYAFDKSITPRPGFDNKLRFHIQGSIDGPPGPFNTYGHAVPWEQYKKNFDEMVDYLKQKNQPLNNTILDLAVCPCSDQDLILANLNSYEKISEFKHFIADAVAYMQNRLEKEIPNIPFTLATKSWVPRIAISKDTTSEQAMDIDKLIRTMELVDYSEKIPYQERPGETEFYHCCTGEFNYTSRNHECYESNMNVITVMPDGTIAECPCTFFHNIPEFRQFYLDNKDYWEYKSCLMRNGSFYNPLIKDSDAERYHDWYIYGGGYIGTYSTYDCLNFNMALELAASWQIDYNYFLDQQKLYDHYTSAFTTSECFRENVNVNHNPFITDLNQIRRWFNGATEYAYNTRKNRLQKVIDKEMDYDNIRARYNITERYT